jgi:hypothetical protein
VSAVATTIARRAGAGTRVAAALVLIGLAALAYYALFSGPTTYSVPVQPGAAPPRTAPQQPGGEPERGAERD